jgi:hypothetical protein
MADTYSSHHGITNRTLSGTFSGYEVNRDHQVETTTDPPALTTMAMWWEPMSAAKEPTDPFPTANSDNRVVTQATVNTTTSNTAAATLTVNAMDHADSNGIAINVAGTDFAPGGLLKPQQHRRVKLVSAAGGGAKVN